MFTTVESLRAENNRLYSIIEKAYTAHAEGRRGDCGRILQIEVHKRGTSSPSIIPGGKGVA